MIHPVIQKALNAYHSKIASRAPISQIAGARRAVADAMEACNKEDADGEMDMGVAGKKVAEADAMAKLAGYQPDRPDPTMTDGADTGKDGDAGTGFAPDVKDTDKPGSPKEAPVESQLKTAGDGGASSYKNPAYTGASAKPWMAHTDRILAEADEFRKMSGNFDPDSSYVKSIRKVNRPFINRLIDEIAVRHKKSRSAQEWFNSTDALLSKGERALCDHIDQAANAATDSVTTANLFNQPSISTALIIQQFQDLEALQFCHGIGPEINNGSSGGYQMFPSGTGEVGSVLRVPTEYYTPPGGYGTQSGIYDAGLSTPENTGIDEGQINISWQTFAPTPRQIAISLTRNAISAMGNGPLNYGAVARSLFHIAFDKARRIDKALYDEMLMTSDEYGAVAVAAESVDLTHNSAWLTGGHVVVNLNPTKTASTAPVFGTDPSVVYGANINSAIRLQGPGNGSTSPYCGTLAGQSPVCRPRTLTDLSSAGQITTSVQNAISLTLPSAGVEGYLDANGQIQDKPGAAGANWAMDYNNGILVAKSAFIGGAAGVVTTATTVNYSYVTNYDNFVANNITSLLATGEKPADYFNRLFNQIDVTAAKMGSAPRFVRPNLMLMSLNASTFVTAATIFYALQSPNGTNLFPSESYFFERTGVRGARINAPWNAGDQSILLLRNGSTKYAVDTPFEIKGPFPTYDSNQKIIAKDVYYGYEQSVVCTPQVKDQSGNILNPVSRKILLR